MDALTADSPGFDVKILEALAKTLPNGPEDKVLQKEADLVSVFGVIEGTGVHHPQLLDLD